MSKCFCKICNKQFKYGDKNSPMLKKQLWDSIVSFYNLTEYEKNADHKRNLHYGKFLNNEISRYIDRKDHHTYICTDCMENALGRELTLYDLNGVDVPFNKDFVIDYVLKHM